MGEVCGSEKEGNQRLLSSDKQRKNKDNRLKSQYKLVQCTELNAWQKRKSDDAKSHVIWYILDLKYCLFPLLVHKNNFRSNSSLVHPMSVVFVVTRVAFFDSSTSFFKTHHHHVFYSPLAISKMMSLGISSLIPSSHLYNIICNWYFSSAHTCTYLVFTRKLTRLLLKFTFYLYKNYTRTQFWVSKVL